jgi:hypothetical protein
MTGYRFRSTFVSHDGTVAIFRCSNCGRTFRTDYSKGPRHKRIGADGVALLASWWAKQRNGIGYGCKPCERKR